MINSSKKNSISIFWAMFTIFIVVVSLISSEALQQNRELFSVTGPLMRVTIINKNNYILGVHCKSGDKDIGFRDLKKDDSYAWKFHVIFFNTTLYFCGFNQREVNKGVFDIYEAIRDFTRCKKCTWNAEIDGIYGYSENPQPASLYYKWLK
ncbi:hypothetical protein EUTSA_v10015570mg [Eutrema salsugineum]|uniref:S-protein homolog n=1 Tax=Eutrema salsugineum TaxID=72664 RepID=V4KRG0_EUTSA|nr:S-protein homolog 6 [Eutrema salsugineum]ESQ40495.1 hypothetical protein EUTSA_v10015570mg [Eutrema salsugineum]